MVHGVADMRSPCVVGASIRLLRPRLKPRNSSAKSAPQPGGCRGKLRGMSRLTASQLYSYLSCPHRVAMDAAGDPLLRDEVSPFVQMLWERGIAHERELVAAIAVPYDDFS